MSNAESNICDICHETFQPDRKAFKRQHICDNLKCKREHKRRYDRQWRERDENSDYFKGRYPDLQEWLKHHPGYLKNYRSRKKNKSTQKSADIQVEITLKSNNNLDLAKIIDDIQVEITTNINNNKRRF
jgi:hypothetical protein